MLCCFAMSRLHCFVSLGLSVFCVAMCFHVHRFVLFFCSLNVRSVVLLWSGIACTASMFRVALRCVSPYKSRREGVAILVEMLCFHLLCAPLVYFILHCFVLHYVAVLCLAFASIGYVLCFALISCVLMLGLLCFALL